MFQTPFADQIRNEANIATMAVGNIYDPDHVNSILLAGRADLVALRALTCPTLIGRYTRLPRSVIGLASGLNLIWQGRPIPSTGRAR